MATVLLVLVNSLKVKHHSKYIVPCIRYVFTEMLLVMHYIIALQQKVEHYLVIFFMYLFLIELVNKDN